MPKITGVSAIVEGPLLAILGGTFQSLGQGVQLSTRRSKNGIRFRTILQNKPKKDSGEE